MKKVFSILVAGAMVALMATSCKGKNEPTPTPTPDPLPESFPRVSLIEEFTGMTCGYCPDGMKWIHEYMTGHESQFVLVLHHVGYQNDQLTATGSSKVISAVAGSSTYAPSMSINRQKLGSIKKYDSPYSLEGFTKYPEATTYASVNITRNYDAATRQLNITVDGQVVDTTKSYLELTVLIKESGIVLAQSDYNNTFEGWSEFNHCNAVRTFVTAPLGDSAIINNHKYSNTYSVTMNNKWDAEKCMIVAYLSETTKHAPIVQAAELPVVEGTTGGADEIAEGITAVPVSATYPEPATGGPSDVTGTDTITMTVANAYYQNYADYGFTYWTLQTYNTTTYTLSEYGSSYSFLPFAQIMFFTEAGMTALPTDTMVFNDDQEAGTAWAGTRDDEAFQIYGSQFYLLEKNYFTQGYLVPGKQWLINTGSMQISPNSLLVSATSLNGSPIILKFTGNIPVQKSSAPARLASKNDIKYNWCTKECAEGTYGKRINR